ncbi:GNAT family N-acetyltransferase [Tolypothrix campylonemoides VB511288]|nr:GNAT family N-acetyltransferase [Tolypothrix campylonemoides VB511288]
MTIRPITGDDVPALHRLLADVGLFEADELATLHALVDDHLAGRGGQDDAWLVLDLGMLAGVAYVARERMTRGTWNLCLLGMHPAQRGGGRGAALLAHVADTLRAAGGRVLLVETAGTPEFAPQRAFYARAGFDEEARIRDFYDAGVDTVVFRMALAPPETVSPN